MASHGAPEWREAWHVRLAKLGVALAVIKNKPAGKSGRQHAEYLSAQLKHQEENWKRKAEELKEEVLSLRQELVLVKVLGKQRDAPTARGDDVLKFLSQDLTEAQHSENDSGFDTQPLSLTPDPADAVLSSTVPPCSVPSSFHTDTRECALSKHMQFLQNLSALRGAVKNTPMDRGDAVVEDTALNMIECILEAHREAGERRLGDVSQLGRFVHASRLVAQTLERGIFKQTVLARAEELLEELLLLLLNNSKPNKFALQDNLTGCLICLGGAGVFRSVLIGRILAHIIHLAEHLWSACQDAPEGEQPQQVDWVRYENSFYLFWTLEQLIQAGSSRAGTEQHHHHLKTQLEQHILPLSDEFPLFALYMWRIEGLLKPACTRGT